MSRRKSTSRDETLDSRNEGVREDREMNDRSISQNRELTDAQRLDMHRAQTYQVALPDLPEIPGYHNCWLTTTNAADPIHRRMMMGYEPIKGSEIPGWSHSTIKSGEYEGCIGVNEMIAFKLPLHLYKMYMTETHHDAPNREEGKLRETLDTIRENAERKGARVEEGDGTEKIGHDPRRPRFEGLGH